MPVFDTRTCIATYPVSVSENTPRDPDVGVRMELAVNTRSNNTPFFYFGGDITAE
jgi:hypothetical protein